ncbi:MAG: hypothetical protein ACXVX7_05540 [Mycobacterium sp.]
MLKQTATVAVTALRMFAGSGGCVIATDRDVAAYRRRWCKRPSGVVDRQIAVHEVLDLGVGSAPL